MSLLMWLPWSRARRLERALHKATAEGKCTVVEQMATNSPGVVNSQLNWKRRAALHIAALNDKPQLAQLLIDRGAVVDAVARGNETPLQCALNVLSFDMVRLLLSNGADPNRNDLDHVMGTPLHATVFFLHSRLCKAVNTADILDAYEECACKIATLLIEAGAINRSLINTAPAGIAGHYGYKRLAQLLADDSWQQIQRGA